MLEEEIKVLRESQKNTGDLEREIQRLNQECHTWSAQNQIQNQDLKGQFLAMAQVTAQWHQHFLNKSSR
jgi:flagellar capping protein FliD